MFAKHDVPVYVHGEIEDKSIGVAPVIIKLGTNEKSQPYVGAKFGRPATYDEPVMYSIAVTTAKTALEIIPWLLTNIDDKTKEIMERAVALIQSIYSHKPLTVSGLSLPSLSITLVTKTLNLRAGYLTQTVVLDGLGSGQSQ